MKVIEYIASSSKTLTHGRRYNVLRIENTSIRYIRKIIIIDDLGDECSITIGSSPKSFIYKDITNIIRDEKINKILGY